MGLLSKPCVVNSVGRIEVSESSVFGFVTMDSLHPLALSLASGGRLLLFSSVCRGLDVISSSLALGLLHPVFIRNPNDNN